MEKNQEWTEPSELKIGDRVRVVQLHATDAYQESSTMEGGVGHEFTLGHIDTDKGNGWLTCDGKDPLKTYWQVRLALLERGKMSETEALSILDAWTAADLEGRTWTMRPYPAGFVACVLDDQRQKFAALRFSALLWNWEFGSQNALPGKAFSDARRLAAEAIKAGLPTIRDEKR